MAFTVNGVSGESPTKLQAIAGKEQRPEAAVNAGRLPLLLVKGSNQIPGLGASSILMPPQFPLPFFSASIRCRLSLTMRVTGRAHDSHQHQKVM